MKIWKIFLFAVSATILPLALIGVGQAQEMNCWGLTPNQTASRKPVDYPTQSSPQEGEDLTEGSTSILRGMEDEESGKGISNG